MNKVLEEIKKLAQEIREDPTDFNGVVDMNTSKIIELCGVSDYEKEVSEFISKEMEE